MVTLIDALAELANDGRWYSSTALGAKLNGRRSALAAISRLRRNEKLRFDLRGVDLKWALYSRSWDGSVLDDADLSNVDFQGANLECVHLGHTNLGP